MRKISDARRLTHNLTKGIISDFNDLLENLIGPTPINELLEASEILD